MPLGKIVFGYHPNWAGTAYQQYRYALLSHVAYFSAEVDAHSGGIRDVHKWPTTLLVPLAQQAHVKPILTCTNMGGADNTALLSDSGRRAGVIAKLVDLVRLRGAAGINIDFEGVPASQRANLSRFAVELADSFRSHFAAPEISFAIPAVDWAGAYDMASLAAVSNYLIMMGYDYAYRGSQHAAAVAPLNGALSVTRSVDRILESGVDPARLVLAVPYYGYDWPVASSNPGAATTGSGTVVTFETARAAAATYGRRWDQTAASPYYVYQRDGAWRQVWYEDEQSLAAKYALIRDRGLAGAGIWALSYDGGRNELWNAIDQAFTERAGAAGL